MKIRNVKFIKELIIAFIIISILTNNKMGLYAIEEGYKDESVYGILNGNGEVESLYVVNALHGKLVDYGLFKDVENLSSLDALTQQEDKVTLPQYESTFYYQGTLQQQELPWDFTFEYLLDGKKVSMSELAGASGELIIHIIIKQGVDSLSTFFDGYAMQVNLELEEDLCSNILAEGATLVEAGGKKQIAFTVLPGNEADINVSATIHDFEMDSITLNAVKMVFDMDVNTAEFTDQFNELSTAVAKLDEGAKGLADGIKEISQGLTDYNEGLNAYSMGMKEYARQGAALSDGLKGLSMGMVQLKNQNGAIKAGIEALELGILQQIDLQLKSMGLKLPSLTKENYKTLLGGQEALSPLLTQIEQSLLLTSGITDYVDGVGTISDGVANVSIGLDDYVNGGKVLSESANKLFEGATRLNEGLADLRDGMIEYQQGTSTFSSETKSLGTDVEEQVDLMLTEFMGSASETKSFVSEKNTQVSSVQFFFRTAAIVREELEEEIKEEPKEYSFWERLLQLFGFLD